ncbi:uncharacterized protein LOC142634809 [Castanea sativa]|uniref:uncharacterized protein LOC142634809 n=1 Tax=Castanea sativa TaxID=21020 RepID=UPI003F64BE08
MQKEIDHLKKKLRCERRRRTPSFSDPSSEDSQGSGYRSRSRTPPDNLHRHKCKESSSRGLENDAMSRALHQIFKSPFTCRVEKGKLPWQFTQSTFTIYNGRMDLVEHFNGLRAGSIDSFMELTRAFGSRFITCSRVSRPLDSLLSMAIREGETLKTYSDRYWEMFNEIDDDFDDVAIRIFKVGLPTEHDLRKSLTKKPVRSVLEKIQNEPYFKCPNKMAGDPMKHNQNLYCHYHQERGYTTEDCKTLWNHLEQLVKEGRLRKFLYRPNGQGDHSGLVNQGNTSPKPPLGPINAIFAASERTGSRPSKVMFVARTLVEESSSELKRIKGNAPPILGFSEEDKIGTIQPHDDALVVTLRIGGYDVKRVMVDQGDGANIMYPDFFQGVILKT